MSDVEYAKAELENSDWNYYTKRAKQRAYAKNGIKEVWNYKLVEKR